MLKILLPYQQRWVNDKSTLKIWLASRQIGKSFAVAVEAVNEALTSRCDNLILSSSERQSKEVMQKVYSHLRYLNEMSDEVVEAESETKEEVVLPNGSRIISLPANPDTVRGFSGNVFLDEFAFHKDAREIWRAMYPAVTRGYKVRITSTPNGKSNMFYDLWAHNGRFSKHMTDIYAAVNEGLAVDIDELRAGIGDPDSWAQEFE
ncbi:MAG: terminase family protein, partial [Thermodesulfovibrionales bacterium]|nr:terminase family protein [Thermodesulfovibrionales bacterium]